MRHAISSSVRAILFSILFFGFTNEVKAQSCFVVVDSDDDYTVEIELTPTQILAPGTCPFGYNFEVEFNYVINFTGNNPPPSGLWTLQGEMNCTDFSNISFPLPNSGGTGVGQTNGSPYNPATDCATATPQSLGCTNFDLLIQGPGINPAVNATCDVALPVEISYLNAVVKGENIHLDWQTVSEINNSHFIVQRSTDPTSWVDLEIVEGQGFSTQLEEYSFVDTDPFAGKNFYRLVQVDFDGSRQISEVLETYLESYELSKVYPNPFNGTTKVTNLSGHVVVYSQLGNVVREFSLDVENPQTVELDLSDLAPGIYLLRQKNQVLKLIKG